MRNAARMLFHNGRRPSPGLSSTGREQPVSFISKAGGEIFSDQPLVALTRTGVVESVHRGRVAIADYSGAVKYRCGDIEERVLMRSVAKPIQALALIQTGAAARFGLTKEELAIVAGSHSGTPDHVRVVSSILTKIGMPVDALLCGVSLPLDEHENHGLMYTGIEPSILQGDCSGKHAGMLAVCVHAGWPTTDYCNPEHPLQQLNLSLLASLAGLSPDAVKLSIDGCEAPTYYIPLRNIATAYARLVSGQGLPPDVGYAARIIVDCMTTFPTIVAGAGRISTRLMVLGRGKVLVKDGAEATFALGLLDKCLGVAIKVSDGGVRAILPTAANILVNANCIAQENRGALQALVQSSIISHHGNPVGGIESLLRFPRPL